jgi:hypothetical protein
LSPLFGPPLLRSDFFFTEKEIKASDANNKAGRQSHGEDKTPPSRYLYSGETFSDRLAMARFASGTRRQTGLDWHKITHWKIVYFPVM